ncbi:MAG: hypothetical protein ACHQRJ_14245 [Alphaproteobacteria bacterium]
MRRRGIDGRKRGGGAFGRSAPVLAILLGLLALAAPVRAENGQWDYWGRTRPLPTYVLAWSADDAVCKRIVRALNAAGPAPASLYGDPIFLRWKNHPAYPRAGRDEPDKTFGQWMRVPFFNNGKPAIAFKFIFPGGYDADEVLHIFDDLQYYKTFKWRQPGDLWNDPRVLKPVEPFLNKSFGDLVALPNMMKDYDYWSRVGIFGSEEDNLASIYGQIYAVVRMPPLELVLVLYFSIDRSGHPVCIIGPKKRVTFK